MVRIWKGFGRTCKASGEGSVENPVVLEMFYVFLHDFFFYTKINSSEDRIQRIPQHYLCHHFKKL